MSTPTDPPLTGPIQTITASSTKRSVVALAAAVVGSTLTIVGFFTWIIAALDGTGTNPGASIGQVLFFVGLTLGTLGIVLAIWSLVKGAPRVVPILAIAVSVAPVVLLVGLSL